MQTDARQTDARQGFARAGAWARARAQGHGARTRPILGALAAGIALLLLGALPASAETSQQGWTIRRLRNDEVTPAITANAVAILRAHRHDPYGTDIPFHADAKLYVGRIERHYHPPGGAARPWGEHPGVSVFEVVDTGTGAAPPPVGPPQPPVQPVPPAPPAPSTGDALDPVRAGALLLRAGSRGAAVAELQRRLAALGAGIAVDGVFGARTEVAVRAFQSGARLRIDGVVGQQTVGALDRAAGAAPASGSSTPW